jgi:flagellar motor switch protein FliG
MKQEDFTKEYFEIVERALALGEKARREGLLALESEINYEKYYQRDVFELGLLLAVDGIDPEIINKILTNIVNQETDQDKNTLETIKKEAVLAIQAGYHPRIMSLLLNSYVSVGIGETMQKFNPPEDENFIFEDVITLTDFSIQAVLRQIDSKDLALALKNEDNEIRSVFFKNMSKRAVDVLLEEIKYMGDVSSEDTEPARKRIIEVILHLIDEDEISFIDPEEEEQEARAEYEENRYHGEV